MMILPLWRVKISAARPPRHEKLAAGMGIE
jgi:hypothetical protein